MKVTLLPGNQPEELLARHPGTHLVSTEPDIIIGFPEGEYRKYSFAMREDEAILSLNQVPIFPKLDMDMYGLIIQRSVEMYAEGNLGDITFKQGFGTRNEPVVEHLPAMVSRTFSYLIPGFLLAFVAGVGLALLATWKPRVGRGLDVLNRLLLSLPDFFTIILIQLVAIQIDKSAGRPVIAILQVQDETPWLIPMLGIAILPGAIIYGTLRIAFEREWGESYIKTAYAKGLSRSMVILRHIVRNSVEDLLTILPRAVTVAITSMVIAEVITWTFGIGGYSFAQNVSSVNSLPVTCAILAAFMMLVNGLIALARKRFTINTKEGI